MYVGWLAVHVLLDRLSSSYLLVRNLFDELKAYLRYPSILLDHWSSIIRFD